MLTWTSVNFWTEVLSLSLTRNNVPYMIRNEAQEAKNKSIKPQGRSNVFSPISYETKKKKKN
jgi:hypothetical protein